MLNTHRLIALMMLAVLSLTLAGCGGVPSGDLLGKWTVDRAATSQGPKPPRNIDAWADATMDFQSSDKLVITQGGQATEYVYMVPSVDDDGWMKFQAQSTSGPDSGKMSPLNAAKIEGDQLHMRIAGSTILVLTRSSS